MKVWFACWVFFGDILLSHGADPPSYLFNSGTSRPFDIRDLAVEEIYEDLPNNEESIFNSRCGADWVENPMTGMCYRLTDEKLTYEETLLMCTSFEGNSDMCSINSAQEQYFISSLLAMRNEELAWIGLREINNDLQWSDGSPVSYKNWARGEPNPRFGFYCVYMFEYVQWYASLCDIKLVGCCKKDPVQSMENEATGCTNYNIFNDSSRLYFRSVTGTPFVVDQKHPLFFKPSPQWRGPGYYRFMGLAGNTLTTIDGTIKASCTRFASVGASSNVLPKKQFETKKVGLVGQYYNSTKIVSLTPKYAEAEVTNCGDFYVYYLKSNSYLRFCGGYNY